MQIFAELVDSAEVCSRQITACSRRTDAIDLHLCRTASPIAIAKRLQPLQGLQVVLLNNVSLSSNQIARGNFRVVVMTWGHM